MRIFFDTEFIEDGKTIDLISIGMVREDGRRFYAENSECALGRVDEWVKENVIPHLVGEKAWMTRAEMREAIVVFAGEKPEFWAYYADYDWVVFCQLFGRMIDLPEGWPKYCRDLKQLRDEHGNPRVPGQVSGEHNALQDALWVKDTWEFIRDYFR